MIYSENFYKEESFGKNKEILGGAPPPFPHMWDEGLTHIIKLE